MTDPRTVRVTYHYEPEGWWADSPDLPGFTAAGATFDEVRRQALDGAAFCVGDDAALVIEQGVPQGGPSFERAAVARIRIAGSAVSSGAGSHGAFGTCTVVGASSIAVPPTVPAGTPQPQVAAS